MIKINIPDEVDKIIRDLEKNKFEAYIVGGCVRDYLLNITPKDWDITTNAKPEEIKKIFDKTIDTGIKHGTVTVLINKKSFEVTTYRIDGEYTDHRRPNNVLYTNNLIQDLSRRDFSINAIAYNKKNGFIDPFGGLVDIKNKIVKCVGNANKRFNEDALRMLRALRFSNQLDFIIEKKTYNAIKKNRELIKYISIERIRDELIKLFSSKRLNNLKFLVDSEILKYISLDFHKHLCDNIVSIKNTLEHSNKDIDVLFSTLLYKFKEPYKFTRFLRFDNKTCETIKIISENINLKFENDSHLIKKIISRVERERFDKLLDVQENIGLIKDSQSIKIMADKLISECIFLKDLAVNGHDIYNLGFKDKQIGIVLNYLLDIVHRYPEKNNRDKLILLAKNFSF